MSMPPIDGRKMTNGERMVLIEQVMAHIQQKVQDNGISASEGIALIGHKLDALDKKWDLKFEELAESHRKDKNDLDVLKARGAGILTALGIVFTVTATAFADVFVKLKDFLLS